MPRQNSEYEKSMKDLEELIAYSIVRNPIVLAFLAVLFKILGIRIKLM